MGVSASPTQIGEIINELYPDGIDDQEVGVVVRDVYRRIKNGGV